MFNPNFRFKKDPFGIFPTPNFPNSFSTYYPIEAKKRNLNLQWFFVFSLLFLMIIYIYREIIVDFLVKLKNKLITKDVEELNHLAEEPLQLVEKPKQLIEES